MFQQHNAKNPGVIYLRKFFRIFGELYTGLLKYFHGKFKFFNVKKKHYNILCPLLLLHWIKVILHWVCSYHQYWIVCSNYLKNSL